MATIINSIINGSPQVVQQTGQSTTAVMSQKAVTDALENKMPIIPISGEEVFTGEYLEHMDLPIYEKTVSINKAFPISKFSEGGSVFLMIGPNFIGINPFKTSIKIYNNGLQQMIGYIGNGLNMLYSEDTFVFMYVNQGSISIAQEDRFYSTDIVAQGYLTYRYLK